MRSRTALILLAVLPLLSVGCVGETVRRVGVRVERGIEFSRANSHDMVDKYAKKSRFIIDETGRAILDDLFNIKADPKTGKLPAAARPEFDKRFAKVDDSKDALRTEIASARILINTNASESRKALELIYKAAEAYGNKETVDMRLDQLTDIVRLLADNIGDGKRTPAPPGP